MAVIGDQQHTGGVLVEPPHRLHAAQAQRPWEQFEHARVMHRPARAFVTHRLVQDQSGKLHERPVDSVDGEH
jgi:hypothetical protein